MIALAGAAVVAEACATATQEDLLNRGDDDGGSAGSAARGGTSGTGFGGTGFGGSSGKGGSSGSAAQGGTSTTGGQGGSAGKGGTAGTGAGQAGEAGDGSGPDPCMPEGELPELRVEYQNGRPDVTQDPDGQIHIVNETGDSIALSELSVRYWMRSEFSCAATLANMVVNITTFQVRQPFRDAGNANVEPTVVELMPDGTGCEIYFALAFTDDAGTLEPTQRANVNFFAQIPIYTASHSQTNDWSYGACVTMPTYWDRVTLYRNGSLVSGREPGGGGGGAGGEGGLGGEGGAR